VIAPPNSEALGFKLNCFPCEYLGDVVSEQQFRATLQQANKIIASIFLRRKRQELTDYTT